MKNKALQRVVIGAALAVGTSFAAQAQVVGLGTAQAGMTVQYGTAIAKVVSEKAGVQMRTQALASTGQYAPRVNAGELEFGISNVIEATFSLRGEGMFEGRATPNLRMAFNMYPLPIVFLAAAKANINSKEDFKTARLPTGWNAQPLGGYNFRAFFANLNIPYETSRPVPIAAMPRMWDLFGQGELDVIFSILNSATNEELSVRVGGIKYLSVDDSPEAVARMQPYLPGSYVTHDLEEKTGEIVRNISYDFVVFTSSEVSDDLVYRVVKAVNENKEQLRSYDGKLVPNMVKAGALEYHPGAIKYYQEVGMWPPAEK